MAKKPIGSRWPEWKIYLWLVVPITIALNLTFVNFHAPDDYDHLKRAYTLLHQPLRTITPPAQSTGAMIDSGLDRYIRGQDSVIMHGKPRTADGRRAYAVNQQVQWSGTQTFSEMPGALSYFPLLYAPQAMGLEAGRLSGATVSRSVLWARFANGLAGIALAAFGLYLLPAGRSFTLLLLLLPRTLLQFASNSADPVLFGLSLIIVAVGIRASRSTNVGTFCTGAALFIAASVRPPVAALSLPEIVGALRRRDWRAFAMVAFAIAAAALWVVHSMRVIKDQRCPAVGALAPKVEAFAWQWPALIGRTLTDRAGYSYASFVGHYGWGDALAAIISTPLPLWIYITAIPILLLGLWQDLTAAVSMDVLTRGSLALGAVVSLLLIFFAMYVGCTVTTQPIIVGVQGRYFVPALFAIAAAVTGLAKRAPAFTSMYKGALVIWVIACSVTMVADAMRFYPHPW